MCKQQSNSESTLVIHPLKLGSTYNDYTYDRLSFLKSSKLPEIFLELWRHLRSISFFDVIL
jgi:hypothetical protein